MVDLGRPSNILSFQSPLSALCPVFQYSQRWAQLQPLSYVPPCCLPCNQRPLLLNYGVWIWVLWWPSPSDPTTDPAIRAQPSHHCFVCCITFFFFFHLWDLYEEGNERERVTRVVFSHLPTSEALNRGSVFTLIVRRVHLKFKGWRAGSITLL